MDRRKSLSKKVVQPVQSIEPSNLTKASITTTLAPDAQAQILTDSETRDDSAFVDKTMEPQKVVESILDDIQNELVSVMEQHDVEPLGRQTQDAQVLESVAQNVDLIASEVDSPTSTIQSTPLINESQTNLIVPQKPPSTAALTDETVIGITDVWPPLEDEESTGKVPVIRTHTLPSVVVTPLHEKYESPEEI